ncbi:PyrF Orotidine-5'-phosphate decarboxylase [Candidatus Nanopelagicaceae bacterium]
MKAPIILATDTSDLEIAKSWAKLVAPHITGIKLGLEFYLNFGAAGVREVCADHELDLFLDLKLHDIPNTVGQAAAAIAELNPKFLTVHASGGSAMIAAAVKELPDSEITAVTILTRLSDQDLTDIGYQGNALDSAVNLASLAITAGAKAIVCSPMEVAAIRNRIGTNPTIITPGVRPVDPTAPTDDQVRTMTPLAALHAGASYVVIGRPITRYWSQGQAEFIKNLAQICEPLIAR